ncbi:MAG: hypothetical protein KG029_09375, partial [Bacteroidetes bacterium]|nr:hypothetical protein [Bacteroidota bacterium]
MMFSTLLKAVWLIFWLSEGKLQGFAIMRKAASGYKICPLFATDVAIAVALYQACLNAAPGEEVFLDIPVTNPAAVNLIKKHN